MRTNTYITLGASAAFGIMAVLLARGWIHGAIDAEFAQTRTPALVETIEVAAAPSVEILVANQDLSFGDRLTAESVRLVAYPEDSLPVGAFEDVADLFSGDGQVLALGAIRMNEVVLPHKVSGAGGQGSLSAKIRPGYRAATVRVDDVTGVAGFVVPGDLVDVYYVDEPNPNADVPNYRGRILLQSVRVLATDQRFSEGSAAPDVARSVTLEVAHMDAQRLYVAQETGLLSLALRALGETDAVASQTVDSRGLSGTTRTVVRRKAKPAPKVVAKPANASVATITVIRGDNSEAVAVVKEDTAQTQAESTVGTTGTLELAGG